MRFLRAAMLGLMTITMLIATPSPAWSSEGRLAVIVISPRDDLESASAGLTEVLISGVPASAATRLVGREMLEHALGQEVKSLRHCALQGTCLMRVASGLDVKWIILGVLGGDEEQSVLTMELLDVATTETVRREVVKGSEDDLAREGTRAVSRLLEGPAAAHEEPDPSVEESGAVAGEEPDLSVAEDPAEGEDPVPTLPLDRDGDSGLRGTLAWTSLVAGAAFVGADSSSPAYQQKDAMQWNSGLAKSS